MQTYGADQCIFTVLLGPAILPGKLCSDFLGVFALLPNLHDSFSESGAKTTQTVYANIYVILSELPPDIVIKKRDGQIVYFFVKAAFTLYTYISSSSVRSSGGMISFSASSTWRQLR